MHDLRIALTCTDKDVQITSKDKTVNGKVTHTRFKGWSSECDVLAGERQSAWNVIVNGQTGGTAAPGGSAA